MNRLINELGGLAQPEKDLLFTPDYIFEASKQAVRNLHDMAKANGATVTVEHQGETIATF